MATLGVACSLKYCDNVSRGVLRGRATALDQLESSLNLPLKLNYWHYRSWPEMYCGTVLCAEDSMLLLPIGSYYSSRSCHMELWSCKGLFLYLNWQFQAEIIMISEVEQERRKGTFIPIFFLLYIYTWFRRLRMIKAGYLTGRVHGVVVRAQFPGDA